MKNCSTGAMTLMFARFANTASFAVAVVVFQEKVGELATLCGLRRLWKSFQRSRYSSI